MGNGDSDEGSTPPRVTPRARLARWRPRWRPRITRRGVRIAAFALGGALVAIALAGRVAADIGPFEASLAARPSWDGQTTVHLAPLGTIVLDTHDWPVALDLSAEQIRPEEARRIARNPQVIDERLGDDLADDVRRALVRLAVRTVAVALAGGIAGGLLARLHWRAALGGAGVAGALVLAAGVGTAASFDANAVSEPRYTGLLTAAPTAVGDIEDIVDRYGEYRAQLSDLVGNVVTLYLAAEDLPTFEPDDGTIRILHVSDIHLNPQAFDLIRQLTEQFGIDAVADTGDITDWGTEPESRLVAEIGRLGVPYVYVRGNHDSHRTQAAVDAQDKAVVLDSNAATVAGLRFWGIGDPRYTPNKDQPSDQGSEQEQAEDFAPEVADRLVDDIPPSVDVVMVHDQRAAAAIGGKVPLVLAGHTHQPRESSIAPENDTDAPDTRLMVEGSTGGAGLRGLQGDTPHPLTATVLYFDPDDKELVAYDRITVQGFGETAATIERHVLTDRP